MHALNKALLDCCARSPSFDRRIQRFAQTVAECTDEAFVVVAALHPFSAADDHIGTEVHVAAAQFSLYDLQADPREESNLASKSLKELEVLKAMFGEYKRLQNKRKLNLTPEMRDRLKSLGYLR